QRASNASVRQTLADELWPVQGIWRCSAFAAANVINPPHSRRLGVAKAANVCRNITDYPIIIFMIEALEPRRLLSADYVASLAFGGTGNEVIKHINVDADGTRQVVGTFTGACDFAPGKSQYLMTSRGGADVFVAAYSESGALIWARQLGGAGDDEA